MARLLSQEFVGGRLERVWAHDDKVTHEFVQDVEPAMDHAKLVAQNADRGSAFRFVANVSATHLEDACRVQAKVWGIPFRECFAEVMQGRTDRAKSVWSNLTKGRDFAKLQARYWK